VDLRFENTWVLYLLWLVPAAGAAARVDGLSYPGTVRVSANPDGTVRVVPRATFAGPLPAGALETAVADVSQATADMASGVDVYA
jgi:hypothetical protein